MCWSNGMNTAGAHDISRFAGAIDHFRHLATAVISWETLEERRRSERHGPVHRRRAFESTDHERSRRDQLANTAEVRPNPLSTGAVTGQPVRFRARLPEADLGILALIDELAFLVQRVEPAIERSRTLQQPQERMRQRQTRIVEAQKKKEAWRRVKLSSPRMNNVKREALRVLWLQRPPDKQTENHVFAFFLSLCRTRPE